MTGASDVATNPNRSSLAGKHMKLADAAKDPALSFAGAGIIEKPLLEALTRGERPAVIPKDSGCTAELIERYLEFMAQNKVGVAQP